MTTATIKKPQILPAISLCKKRNLKKKQQRTLFWFGKLIFVDRVFYPKHEHICVMLLCRQGLYIMYTN